MSPFKPKPTGIELVRSIRETATGLDIGEGRDVRPAASPPVATPPKPTLAEAPQPEPKRMSAAQRAKIERPRVEERAAEPVLQVNFKCSIQMFRELTRGVTDMGPRGSQRRFLAQLMRNAGFDVPDADINPPESRRRFVD